MHGWGGLLHLQIGVRTHRSPLCLKQLCIVGEGAPHPSETGWSLQSAFWGVKNLSDL